MQTEFTTTLVLATKKDILAAKGLLKIGKIIFLKSKQTASIHGPFVIDKYTSLVMLKEFFDANAIYVQPSFLLTKDIHDVLQLGAEKAFEVLEKNIEAERKNRIDKIYNERQIKNNYDSKN